MTIGPCTPHRTVAAPRRLPLRRPARGRWFGGVALGLAAHLDVPVGLVRLAFVVLTPVAGIGPLLYVFWWLAIPAGDPADAAQEVRPSALTRLARRQAIIEPGRRIPVTDIAIGAVLVDRGRAADRGPVRRGRAGGLAAARA